MPKTIQIRHVPDSLHRRLKAQAALAGMSLSGYLVREVGTMAERPTPNEIRARLAALPPIRLKTSPTKILRMMRGRR